MSTAQPFGGLAAFLDRSDINTDEIIPAQYLSEITKPALAPHLMEDLRLDGFDPASLAGHQVIVTRSNFGCGSSREHAVWVLEVNGFNVVIAESFARIFRQNMFNCGILAVELSRDKLDQLFALAGPVHIQVDVAKEELTAKDARGQELLLSFTLNPFDKKLVEAGGWVAYADANY